MSIFSKIGAWFAKVFKNIKVDAAKIAVAVTEGIQDALKSGAVSGLAGVIEGIFPGVKNLPSEIVEDLNKLIPKILASELALQGLPDSPTPEDLLEFENKVLAAFNVHDQKSKLYTVLSAQIYGILKRRVGDPDITFADLVADVEEAYQDYKRDLADQETEQSN